MRRLICLVLSGSMFILIGCGDADTVSKEPEGKFVPYERGTSSDEGSAGGNGSAVFDPCLGPRCERPNWEGRESIIDPLTDNNVAPHVVEAPPVDVSTPH